ncbi:MAG TPA: maltotransferase domain-containing protein, partial [Nonomuraea sp.]|nr:maltotransferase domain-containing protein [Nonomuraea sp.]
MIGRIPITDISPVVDCGQWPAKAVAGETFQVSATVFREGHDAVAAGVVLTAPDGQRGRLRPMRELAPGTDRWGISVCLPTEGDWLFRVEAWSDPIATWLHDAEIKIPRGMDTDLMCEEGARLFERAARAVRQAECPAPGNGNGDSTCGHRAALLGIAATLRDEQLDPRARLSIAQLPETAALLEAHPLRTLVTRARPRKIRVDRRRALYGSWYEFFPRSEGAVVSESGISKSGNFQTAAKRLPAIAKMGFDVVYLPPIHPIGHTFRKGRNNTLSPEPDEPGSPWAIGSEDGGHDAIHPDLGTIEDFDQFTARTRELGMEVALDFALQCSPDHPWVKEHPEWFTIRADGTIAYAENPPKKYQDIYP